jgi:hypothetical protein
VRTKALAVAASLALALAIKRWYSQADAASLHWLLAPTAWCVGALFRAPFVFVDGYGYVSAPLRFAIVPACAGVNFLIIALGSFGCGVVPLAGPAAGGNPATALSACCGEYRNRLPVAGAARRALWIAGGACACLLVTLLANTARIALAVWLQLHPLAVAVDRAELHRACGCAIYLGFLFAFYALARSLARRHAVA